MFLLTSTSAFSLAMRDPLDQDRLVFGSIGQCGRGRGRGRKRCHASGLMVVDGVLLLGCEPVGDGGRAVYFGRRTRGWIGVNVDGYFVASSSLDTLQVGPRHEGLGGWGAGWYLGGYDHRDLLRVFPRGRGRGGRGRHRVEVSVNLLRPTPGLGHLDDHVVVRGHRPRGRR